MLMIEIFAYSASGHYSGHDLSPLDVAFLILALIFGIAASFYFRQK
jgi:hypothetical protein